MTSKSGQSQRLENQGNSPELLPEIDPKKLLTKDGVIGYEKPDGFQEMTNFTINITGYVADSNGTVIGYLAKIQLVIVDDNATEDSRNKEYFLSNKDMSSHLSLINALKSEAIWTQPTKDPYLPQFVYGLCRAYMARPREERRKKIPVSVIGRQNTGIWVFNDTVQIDEMGKSIPKDEQSFILLDDTSLPVLTSISTIDDGESLGSLIEAEKDLLGNNFAQGIMAIACVAIGANYELVVKEYGGCALPVLFGAPQSAKTTALSAALSVVGNVDIVQDMTFKAIMDVACKTTIPFGWDDCDKSQTMKQVAVAFFNQGGTRSYHGRSVPKTFPITTTNVDGKNLKVLSRWMRIPFLPLDPVYRSSEYRKRYSSLQSAMAEACSSVSVVTSFVANKLIAAKNGDLDAINDKISTVADSKEFTIDERALFSYSLLLFVCKVILEKVGLKDVFSEVEKTFEEVVLPSYAEAVSSDVGKKTNISPESDLLVEDALNNFFASIKADNVKDVASFVSGKIKPSSCSCGESVSFNVPAVARFMKEHEINGNISDATLRHFITKKKIGCVGKSTKFYKMKSSSTSAHVSRRFLAADILKEIDQAFRTLSVPDLPGQTKLIQTQANSDEQATPTVLSTAAAENTDGQDDKATPTVVSTTAQENTDGQGIIGYVMDQDDIDKAILDDEILTRAAEELESKTVSQKRKKTKELKSKTVSQKGKKRKELESKTVSQKGKKRKELESKVVSQKEKKTKGNAVDNLKDSLSPDNDLLPDKRTRKRTTLF